ncbi:MAG TPA: hypothetical protein PLJ21_08695 [Pseudobdellovibrionaceae bacterium]|nr:hypothetical protein [Pseudobdellovibrionaceae bacterium]
MISINFKLKFKTLIFLKLITLFSIGALGAEVGQKSKIKSSDKIVKSIKSIKPKTKDVSKSKPKSDLKTKTNSKIKSKSVSDAVARPPVSSSPIVPTPTVSIPSEVRPAIDVFDEKMLIEKSRKSFQTIRVETLSGNYEITAYQLDPFFWVSSLSQLKFTQGPSKYIDIQNRPLRLVSYDLENGLVLFVWAPFQKSFEQKLKSPSLFSDLVNSTPIVGSALTAISRNLKGKISIYKSHVGGVPVTEGGKYTLESSFEKFDPGLYVVKNEQGKIVGFINQLTKNELSSAPEIIYVYSINKLIKIANRFNVMGLKNIEDEILKDIEKYSSPSFIPKNKTCKRIDLTFTEPLVMRLSQLKGVQCDFLKKLDIDSELDFKSIQEIEIQAQIIENLNRNDRALVTQTLLTNLKKNVESKFLNYSRHDLPICERGWLVEKPGQKNYYQMCSSRIKGTKNLNSTFVFLENLEKKDIYRLRAIFFEGYSLEKSQDLLREFLVRSSGVEK